MPLTSEDGGLNNDGTYAFTPIGQWSRESGPIYPKLNREDLSSGSTRLTARASELDPCHD